MQPLLFKCEFLIREQNSGRIQENARRLKNRTHNSAGGQIRPCRPSFSKEIEALEILLAHFPPLYWRPQTLWQGPRQVSLAFDSLWVGTRGYVSHARCAVGFR